MHCTKKKKEKKKRRGLVHLKLQQHIYKRKVEFISYDCAKWLHYIAEFVFKILNFKNIYVLCIIKKRKKRKKKED